MKKQILTMAFSLISASLFSQDIQDTMRHIELPLSVIKVYTLDGNLNVISKKSNVLQINNQAQDLPFLLNQVSSVVTSSDAGTGTGYSGIRIRGADLTRINVTMNGVPLNDAESQTTYFVDLPDMASSVESIEINKGVASSTNGVGNFGASISIKNLDINYVMPHVLFSTDFGSFNTFKTVLKASTGLIQNKFVSTIRLSTILSAGYIQRSKSNLKGLQWTSKYILDSKTQLIFNYMKGYEKTGQAWNGVPQDSLNTNRTFNELGIKSDGTFYNNQTDNYGQDYYQFFTDRKVTSHLTIGSTLFYTKGKGYYEEYKIGESFADYHLPNVVHGNDTISSTDLIRQLWLDNDFYGGRLYATYITKKLDAGLYLNYNEYKGRHFGNVVWSDLSVPDHYQWYKLTSLKKDFNTYAMLDYRVSNKLSIFTDAQVRLVQYEINGFRKNPTIHQNLKYNFFNPKVKLSYKINEKQFVSILVGIAQKEPNREDVEAGVNTLPKPEKLLDIELNYAIQPIRNLLFSANVFLMNYKDQLVLSGKLNDVGAYTRTNVDKSSRMGIEIEARYKLNSMLNVNANIAFSKNKIANFTEYIDDYDNATQLENHFTNIDISFSPSVIAGGSLSISPFVRYKKDFPFTEFALSWMPKYVGKQFLDNTMNTNRALKSYLVQDVILSCPFKLKQETKLCIRIGVYNALNLKYESNGYTYSYLSGGATSTYNYYYPQAGRRFIMGASLEF